MFNVNLIELPELIRIDGEMRHYETPTGERYPSVTTVLGNTKDKSGLIAWRKRVGDEEADRTMKRSGRRGTAVHLMCEKLVLNQPIDFKAEMPLNVMMFKQLEKFLTENVNSIRVSEGSLFSHKLKVAGSVDLVANYRNHAAIIDFKTSAKNKRTDWIEDYFLQAAMYSYMLWEMTQMYHPKLVIAIAMEEEIQPQIFEEDVNNWLDKARDRCKQFHNLNK
jgi:genome maintenance exonuclease 1